MRANGKTIRQTELEFIYTATAPSTRAAGRTICRKAAERSRGMTALNMRDSTPKERKTERANTHGTIRAPMRETGLTTKSLGRYAHQKGIYNWVDGRVYEGEWKDNNMHGKGVYKWKDGRVYEGDYYLDKKHGFGRYTWADGRIYEGQWYNGKQHGEGKYTLQDGTVKTGIWEAGKRLRWINE